MHSNLTVVSVLTAMSRRQAMKPRWSITLSTFIKIQNGNSPEYSLMTVSPVPTPKSAPNSTACMAGEIDMIITKSISRFARNTLDYLKYIRQLKEKNIPV